MAHGPLIYPTNGNSAIKTSLLNGIKNGTRLAQSRVDVIIRFDDGTGNVKGRNIYPGGEYFSAKSSDDGTICSYDLRCAADPFFF